MLIVSACEIGIPHLNDYCLRDSIIKVDPGEITNTVVMDAIVEHNVRYECACSDEELWFCS